jgi:uncharacterized membrane protein
MAGFCTNCGAQLPDNANHCPSCGKPAPSAGPTAAPAAAPTQSGAAGGLTDNVAGLLAYVTIIPAIIFLVIEPYNRSRFIRFHAFQSIFFFVAVIIVSVVMPFIAVIPFFGVLLWALVCLAELILWLLLMFKAYGGEMWKLPVVGDIAEKQANA